MAVRMHHERAQGQECALSVVARYICRVQPDQWQCSYYWYAYAYTGCLPKGER